MANKECYLFLSVNKKYEQSMASGWKPCTATSQKYGRTTRKLGIIKVLLTPHRWRQRWVLKPRFTHFM